MDDGEAYEMYGSASYAVVPETSPMYFVSDGSVSHHTTSFNAQYRHNGNPFLTGIGLSVGGVSISFTGDWLTYTTATSINFMYRY